MSASDPRCFKANSLLRKMCQTPKNNFVWLRHKINFPVVAWWRKSQRFSSLRFAEKLGKSSAPCESLTDKSEAITTSLVEKTIKETLRGKVEFFLWEKRFQRLVGFLKQNFSKMLQYLVVVSVASGSFTWNHDNFWAISCIRTSLVQIPHGLGS